MEQLFPSHHLFLSENSRLALILIKVDLNKYMNIIIKAVKDYSFPEDYLGLLESIETTH